MWTCSRCLRAQQRLRGALPTHSEANTALRSFTTGPARRQEAKPAAGNSRSEDAQASPASVDSEPGALSRRLQEMVEETIDTGSKSDRKTMQGAGFSDELKKQLEERIAQTAFSAQHQKAASQASMPSYAGRGTRDSAAAPHWTGSESTSDASLRMLDDAHKRLRTPFKAPRIPSKVDLRPAPKQAISAADRLARARDKTSIYAISQEVGMTEQEREKYRQELKERFTPGARPMPTTLQGLSALANERIEDAIARGQFKNIRRGKGTNVERDYNANSPFLDTTEYFMNKIIQKQEIVPPWIEKQQELVKAVNSFRGRLRNDWKRHAARSISSSGGTLADQVRRAKGYALAEEMVNPRLPKREELSSSISSDGVLRSITVEERLAAGVYLEPEERKASTQTPASQNSPAPPPQPKVQVQEEVEINVTETEKTMTATAATATTTTAAAAAAAAADNDASTAIPPSPPEANPAEPSETPPPQPDRILPMPHPFRDPAWLATEAAYHTLAVAELNSLTRSYNLMAPKIAQKPYYNLDRELKRCFADVAPLLADEIQERSRRPAVKLSVGGGGQAGTGVLGRIGPKEFMGTGHEKEIRDEGEEKGYGFKQFFRDIFRKEGKTETL